ncbi:TPA: hypothetical protein NV934_004427 [Escherichia coli]|nr:hypothetical protein [Escherichia coli]
MEQNTIPVANNERQIIIVDGDYQRISPNALKLMIYMLKNPAEAYGSQQLRDGAGLPEKLQLKRYFDELQGLGLLSCDQAWGEIHVSNLARRVDNWGVPVFERCKE